MNLLKDFKKFFSDMREDVCEKTCQSIHRNGNNIQVRSNSGTNTVSINVPDGSSISLINGKLYVNGKPYDNNDDREVVHVNVVVEGNSGNVELQNGVVSVNGVAKNVKTTNGSIKVSNDVGGDVSTTNGSVTANNISGNVSTRNGNINKSFKK